jgi:AcrR family transcriptional regulator
LPIAVNGTILRETGVSKMSEAQMKRKNAIANEVEKAMRRKKPKRKDPILRREEILITAIMLACRIGYKSITREQVAKVAGTSCALVTRYFTTMEHLKKMVVKTSVDREFFPVIAQAINVSELSVNSLKPKLKAKVMSFLTNQLR